MKRPLAALGGLLLLVGAAALFSHADTGGLIVARIFGNAGAAVDAATGAAVPANALLIGGNGSGNLTPFTVCDTNANINQTAGATVITGTAAKKIYVCSLNLTTATAQNIAVVEGTGTVCATGIAAFPGTSGGTTAATGWNWAANEGIALAPFSAFIEATAADNVCILQSSTGQVSGSIWYTVR